MDVKEILLQVSNLGSGLDDPTEQDLEVYLRHLNLVHLELYRLTAVYNPAIPIYKIKTYVRGSGILRNPIDYFNIECIHNVQNCEKLQNILLSEIIQSDPILSKSGKPEFWCNYNKSIMVYPKPTKRMDVVVWYRPKPVHFYLSTLEEDIPYPNFYHQLLVDGTSYYVFQSEAGMRNQTEMALAKSRWEKGKLELIAYLQNIAPIKYGSTNTGKV